MSDDVLTIKESAALLNLDAITVYTMANVRGNPCSRSVQWRIKRAELALWASAQPRGRDLEGAIR